MNFLIVLACTLATVLLCKPAIKRYPAAWYVLALGLDALFAVFPSLLPPLARDMLLLLVQKCTLSLALLTIVMFIGVLPRASKARSHLQPIRAELSIMGCILAFGHMLSYLASYLTRLIANPSTLNPAVLAALAIALVLFVLLVILGATSLPCIKRQMPAGAWAKLQRLSYVFFALVFLHLTLMIGPSALAGSEANTISLAVYATVFASYALLRIRRAIVDGKRTARESDSHGAAS